MGERSRVCPDGGIMLVCVCVCVAMKYVFIYAMRIQQEPPAC